jgi:hypothetical protein
MKLIVSSLAVVILASGASGASRAARAPVLVELFTSEGCSSCPAADELLTRLHREQPVANAEIIPLAFHVDYWDHQGWKDPFASKAFTARQRDYSRIFGSDRLYTPQMIVDGREEFVGSDEALARRAAQTSASVRDWPFAWMRVCESERQALDGSACGTRDSSRSMCRRVDERLMASVRRGETRPDAGTQRRRAKAGRVGALDRDAFVATQMPLERGWNAAGCAQIVWLQGRKTRRLSAASAA